LVGDTIGADRQQQDSLFYLTAGGSRLGDKLDKLTDKLDKLADALLDNTKTMGEQNKLLWALVIKENEDDDEE
jgi:hypothetical protein